MFDEFQQIYSTLKSNGVEKPLEETLKLYDILSHKKKPFGENKVVNGNVAILSLSGGHGVICADLLKSFGLSLVRFTEQEEKEMREMINPVARNIASLRDPIDLTGSAQDEDIEAFIRYLSKIERIEKDSNGNRNR